MERSDLITINPAQIIQFTQEAGKLVFKPSAEKELLKLLDLEVQIQEAIKKVKEQIALAGRSIDDNFKGVIGTDIRATFRTYGDKYGYNPELFHKVESFLKPITRYHVDSDKVKKYMKQIGSLPLGVFEKDRSPVISFSVKK